MFDGPGLFLKHSAELKVIVCMSGIIADPVASARTEASTLDFISNSIRSEGGGRQRAVREDGGESSCLQSATSNRASVPINGLLSSTRKQHQLGSLAHVQQLYKPRSSASRIWWCRSLEK